MHELESVVAVTKPGDRKIIEDLTTALERWREAYSALTQKHTERERLRDLVFTAIERVRRARARGEDAQTELNLLDEAYCFVLGELKKGP